MNDRNHDHFREATKKVDYIDRNEAIEAIKNDALDLVYYRKKEAIECLDAVPAADVRPVVRGEWEITSGQIENAVCSCCGAHFQAYYSDYQYCPRCGADMIGKEVQGNE